MNYFSNRTRRQNIQVSARGNHLSVGTDSSVLALVVGSGVVITQEPVRLRAGKICLIPELKMF